MAGTKNEAAIYGPSICRMVRVYWMASPWGKGFEINSLIGSIMSD